MVDTPKKDQNGGDKSDAATSQDSKDKAPVTEGTEDKPKKPKPSG